MKIGIIVYSKSGNTKIIAEKIKKHVETMNNRVDVIDIVAEHTPGFLKAGYLAIKQKSLPIKNDGLDVSTYDLILIGCPVWAGKPAPMIKTMIEQCSGFNKTKTCIFLTCGGGEGSGSKSIQILKSYLQDKGANIRNEKLIVQMNRNGEIKKAFPSIEGFVSTFIDGE